MEKTNLQPLYLDYNATAPLRPEVREAMIGAFDSIGNPSSIHQFGRAARSIVEEARIQVAALVGAKPSQIIFTGSGTEANVMALRGFANCRVLVSATEHDSVLKAHPQTELIPVRKNGILDLEALERLLSNIEAPALVSVMIANNETGVIQPIAEISQLTKKYEALFHTDAVQAAGRVAIDITSLNVDLLSLSAHKIGGPKGVGALVIREGLDIQPLLTGGGQERRRRSGTENVPGIAGFGAATKFATPNVYKDISSLRDHLERELKNQFPEIQIYGDTAPRIANTTCLSMPGVPSHKQLISFDLEGIAVSAGSACSSGKVHASHVLKAMGIPDNEALTAIRVSLGWTTTEKDIDRFISTWAQIYQRLKNDIS